MKRGKLFIPYLYYSIAALLLLFTGTLYYLENKKVVFDKAENKLETFNDLKIKEILKWFSEREGDILFFKNNLLFVDEVEAYLTGNEKDTDKLRLWLKQTQESHGYDIFLVSADSKQTLILGKDTSALSYSIVDSCLKALRTEKKINLDIYRQFNTDNLFYAKMETLNFKDSLIKACLVFRTNIGNQFIDQIIARNETSQNVDYSLVRNEGDSLFYINNERFDNINQLKASAVIDNSKAPFVNAAMGIQGTFKGIDHKGVEIFASVKRIPGSQWMLVVHQDIEKIQKTLAAKKWLILSYIILIALLFFVWHLRFLQKEKNRYLKEELRLNNALMHNREVLQTVIQSSPLPIVVITDANIITIWNKAATLVFGWKASEVSANINPVFESIDNAEFKYIQTFLSSHNETYIFETSRPRKDGILIDLRCWVSNLIDPVTDEMNLLFIFDDITESKRIANEIIRLKENLELRVQERTRQLSDINSLLEEEITIRKKSEEAISNYAIEVESLYNNAPCGYHSLDSEGRFLNINDTELNWIGRKREDVINKMKFTDFLTSEGIEVFNDRFPKFKESGKVSEVEFDLICEKGHLKSILLSALAVYNENGKFIMDRSTIFDISDLKMAKLEVEELNKSLTERANQLEILNKELESFTYSVSHDLKAPLRSIQGFSDIILEEYSVTFNEEVKRLFGIVKKNAKRMDQLINDLLNLSKITRSNLKFIPLNMNDLITNIINSDFGDFNVRGKINVAHLIPATGDPVLIQQVWSNLISNAIKYSQNKASPTIDINSSFENGSIIYSVKDNGVGFDPEFSHKLFITFQRLHGNEFEGSGVGLAIVKRIIVRHGGDVWAEGKVDEGATFYFSLPKTD